MIIINVPVYFKGYFSYKYYIEILLEAISIIYSAVGPYASIGIS